MESSRPKEKRKTKERFMPRNGDRHEKNEQELDGIRKEGPGQNSKSNKPYNTNGCQSTYLDTLTHKVLKIYFETFLKNNLKKIHDVRLLQNDVAFLEGAH
ncbi:unnamed protein product [Schistosoma margrebowiei]|uniref:Uncharacterized protein n=1 Tax=Schistosoma margrebowiei TaxID=48269 RepID=A0A183N477_9TREM|nr:unnamed protein product [Schistosoma margrebowiei]